TWGKDSTVYRAPYGIARLPSQIGKPWRAMKALRFFSKGFGFFHCRTKCYRICQIPEFHPVDYIISTTKTNTFVLHCTDTLFHRRTYFYMICQIPEFHPEY